MSLAQFKGRPAFLLLPPSHCHITGRAAIHSWVMVVAGVSPLRWRPTAERASTSGGPHEPQTTEQDHKADDPSNPVRLPKRLHPRRAVTTTLLESKRSIRAVGTWERGAKVSNTRWSSNLPRP